MHSGFKNTTKNTTAVLINVSLKYKSLKKNIAVTRVFVYGIFEYILVDEHISEIINKSRIVVGCDVDYRLRVDNKFAWLDIQLD